MLENNVKHKDIEVLKLEQDLKSFADSTSVDNAKLCEHCSSDSESNLTMHTGNFRGNTNNLKVHRLEMHDFPCKFCDVNTTKAEALKQHKTKQHGVVCEF